MVCAVWGWWGSCTHGVSVCVCVWLAEREFTLVTIHDPNYVEPEEEVEEVEAE